MFKLHISKKAEKDIKKIKQIYQITLIHALREIKEDPFVGKPLTKELNGQFAYKIGVYRIIYRIDHKDETVEILSAGHRATVYN
jgi:addiction module RelE/StbE family toxin